jgi:hypothetical protein
LIVPHCPPSLAARKSPPKSAAAGGLLRRLWPAARAVGIGLVLVVIAAGVGASGHLISRAIAFWVTLSSLGLIILLATAEDILERLKLIDKSKPESASAEEAPVARPPPPINELAPGIDKAPVASPVLGGELPGALSASRRKGRWRLEGDFDGWRRDDSAPG